MKIPEKIITKLVLAGETPEQRLTEIVTEVCHKISRRFKIGYYTPEDLYQLAWEEALEALAKTKYNQVTALEKFLYSHIRNRFVNLYRDKVFRAEAPCNTCPLRDLSLPSQCRAFDDKLECDKYAAWKYRNNAKQNLMNLSYSIMDADSPVDNAYAEVDYKDYMNAIAERLPPEMVDEYYALCAGETISPDRIDLVRSYVSEIIDALN